MDSESSKELKYLMSLCCYDPDEAVLEELFPTYEKSIKDNKNKANGENVYSYLQKNIEYTPIQVVHIMKILSSSNIYDKDDINRIYKKIINEEIDRLLEKIKDDSFSNKNELLSTILFLISEFSSQYNNRDEVEQLMSKIDYLKSMDFEREVYYSLLSHQSDDLLNALSIFESQKPLQITWPMDSEVMLKLCFISNKHWLKEIVAQLSTSLEHDYEFPLHPDSIAVKLWQLVLINLLNNTSQNVDLSLFVDKFHSLISYIENDNTNDFLRMYFNEISREFNLITFCNSNSKRKSFHCWNNIFCNNSALSTISQMCNLSQIDSFEMKQVLNANCKLLKKIDKNIDCTNQWDVMNYNAYCLITKVINLICSNVGIILDDGQLSSNIEELKELISSLNPVSYRIEIMHNIFTCLFIRYEYFSCEESKPNQNTSSYSDCSYFAVQNVEYLKTFSNCRGFVCDQKLLKEIVLLLKECVFDILEQNMISKDNENYEIHMSELKTLENYISSAIWRWELIKTATFEEANVLHLCDFYKNINDSSSDDSKSIGLPVRRKKKFKKQRSKSLHEKRPLNKDKPKDVLRSINKPDFISLMLSSPSTLLALCLESNNFINAYKITEIYDMSNTEAYMEVYFTEQFIAIVKRIKNMSTHFDTSSNINQIEIVTGSSVISTTVVSIVESFLSMQKFPYNSELSDMVETYPQFFPPQIYDYSNSAMIYLIDLLMSTGVNYDITCGILNVAEKKSQEITTKLDGNDSKNLHFVFFIRNMISLFCGAHQNNYHNIKNTGICHFLINDKLPFVYKDYEFFVDNMLIISNFHIYFFDGIKKMSKDKIETFTEILTKQRKLLIPSDICNVAVEIEISEQDCCYLNYFLTYLYKLSHLMILAEDSINEESNASIKLEILNISTHKIISDLMSKNLPIDIIETFCKKLGINLIHKIGLNHCPPIKCSFTNSESVTYGDLFEIADGDDYSEEESIPMNFQRPNQNVATYVLINNWVIANILKKIHSDNTEHVLQQSIDTRTKFLDTYLQMKRFDVLKKLNYNNKALAALHYSYDSNSLRALLLKTINTESFERSLKIINSLPEHMLSNPSLEHLKNTILYKLSQDCELRNHWSYLFSITNVHERAEEIIENLTRWDYDGVLKILNFLNHHTDIKNEDLKSQIIKWMDNIHVYQKISQIIGRDSWAEVYSLSNEDPEYILQLLLDTDQFELCLQWSNFHEISYNMKNLILHNLIKQYPTSLPPNNLNTLIIDMPIHQSIALCKDMLMKLRNIDALKTITKFLIQNSQEYLQFENIRIGIEIISHIELSERNFFWELITMPLLIIEQFLMNAKLDKLGRILKLIKPLLKSDPLGDNLFYNMSLINSATISINSVEALLRIYAAKALEFKSSKNKTSAYYNQPKELLIQSIDSINQIGSGAFVMPEVVPNKDQWVADNFSNHCMVCKTTIFSILIRRHHCRRCGRLVCYSCSRRKMIIAGHYSDIKVRFCDECHKQTVNKAETETNHMSEFPPTTSVQSDSPSMEWCLTMNEKHNREVRKEFIYDFSPNVNLCLSIMKMHSINLAYPRFLLDRSSELSKAAANTEDGVLELVHMRRALLLSCAVLYARPIPTASASITDTALVHTEHQLAVTDALARLATNGCHNMMPQVDSINTHYIRELMKAEKWDLALEMSTKFGMPQSGVLAAWGKACLKSGCFNMARKKFAICFKKNASAINQGNDNADNQSFTESIISHTESYSDLSRIKNNSALLDEIIMLIENNSYYMSPQILKKTEIIKDQSEISSTEPLLNIIHALSSLQKIKQGDFSDFETSAQYVKKTKQSILTKKHNYQNEKLEFKRKLESFFYKECVYYLTTYGTHRALINFYLKYGDLAEALQHCQLHSVEKETFTDVIFMTYLKNDIINTLLKTMFEIDSTWTMWTDYLLYACRVLEHKGWLQHLHSVQIGIGDYVRAAITCVALYTRPTQPPHVANLHVRNHYLAQARGHLQHVPRNVTKETDQTQTRSLHLRMDSASMEKHNNTIMRQMEIITFLYVNEMSGRITEKMINDLMIVGIEDNRSNQCSLPTLFGSQIERIKLGALLLICGTDIREGFAYVSRLIKEYQLNASKLFITATRELINNDRYEEIPLICELIQKVMTENSSKIIDDLVEASVSMIVRRCDSNGQLFDEVAEMLIAKTENVSIKISCYIECRILKTAYHLAIQNKRFNDLKRIMREAEKLGQIEVKNACLKKISALKL